MFRVMCWFAIWVVMCHLTVIKILKRRYRLHTPEGPRESAMTPHDTPPPLDLRDAALARVSVTSVVLFPSPSSKLERDGLGLEQPTP